MSKYFILENDYKETQLKKEKLLEVLNELKWDLDESNPDYVFSIGGDGTFLKSFHKYNDQLDYVKFIPIKSGGIGYYTHNNLIEDILNIKDISKLYVVNLEVLEINFKSNSKIYRSVNEFKILNNITTTFIDVNINNQFLQRFQGSGLVFSTASGSGGYNKASGGSLILHKDKGIWQVNEIFPVNTSNYRSLNSSLILSKEDVVDLTCDFSNNTYLSIDAQKIESDSKQINIKISNKRANIIKLKDKNCSNQVKVISDIFTKKREY